MVIGIASRTHKTTCCWLNLFSSLPTFLLSPRKQIWELHFNPTRIFLLSEFHQCQNHLVWEPEPKPFWFRFRKRVVSKSAIAWRKRVRLVEMMEETGQPPFCSFSCGQHSSTMSSFSPQTRPRYVPPYSFQFGIC